MATISAPTQVIECSADYCTKEHDGYCVVCKLPYCWDHCSSDKAHCYVARGPVCDACADDHARECDGCSELKHADYLEARAEQIRSEVHGQPARRCV